MSEENLNAVETEETVVTEEEVVNENRKLYSILAYLGLLFLIGLFLAKDDPVVKFHVNQGLILTIASFVLACLFPIWLIFMIMGIINAVNGEMKPLPLIGKITIIK